MPLNFKRHILANGLRLIVHEDASTPLASCNVVYNVGSRDEQPDMTGMAHLFEHFMFTGSKNVDNYDAVLQNVGGINNAYTTQDLTHYYITLPAANIEHALWLESDRMLELAFKQESLNVQKQVVIEEFKENFLNQPYGDIWLIFNNFFFKNHPYKWMPIGKEISHIEKVTMQDMKAFFYHFYRPNNAVLCLSGNIHFDEVVPLVEKWFGDIPAGDVVTKNFPKEEEQTQRRFQEVHRDVPADLLFKGWPICGRLHPDFYAYDLLSDLFGSGQSSFLYKKFVIDQPIFTDLSAYVSGTIDPGMFNIIGRPVEDMPIEDADKMLCDFLYNTDNQFIKNTELQKVKNRVATIILQNEIKIEDRSSSLAVSECYSCVEDFNDEISLYNAVSGPQINNLCQQMFAPEKENTLYYKTN